MVCSGRHRPDVAARPPDLAPQWAPLWWPDWAEQGRNSSQTRRGPGQDLEALFWYSSPTHGWGAWLLSDHQQGDVSEEQQSIVSFYFTNADIIIDNINLCFLFRIDVMLTWLMTSCPAVRVWRIPSPERCPSGRRRSSQRSKRGKGCWLPPMATVSGASSSILRVSNGVETVKQGFLLHGVSYTNATCPCGAGEAWPYFGAGPLPALLALTQQGLKCWLRNSTGVGMLTSKALPINSYNTTLSSPSDHWLHG